MLEKDCVPQWWSCRMTDIPANDLEQVWIPSAIISPLHKPIHWLCCDILGCHITLWSARKVFDAHLKSIIRESNDDGPGIHGWAGEADFGNTII
jgi:hypothetical protein